jgi:hypothetical protein
MREIRGSEVPFLTRNSVGDHGPLALGAIALAVASMATLAANWHTRATAHRPGQSVPLVRQSVQRPAERQWVEMQNVDLGITDSVTVRVERLRGEVFRTDSTRPATLDDARSFRIRVTDGRVSMTGGDLGAALNSVVFAYRDAPLRDLKVRTDSQEIIQTGILHRGVDLRFRLRGVLSLMPDGRVRIHPASIRVLGLNGERVLGLVGLHLENLLDLRGAHGVSVKGDDLYLDPLAILPPPEIVGRLASIEIQRDRVMETFVQASDDSMFRRSTNVDTSSKSFVHFRGGQLRFGKLLMSDADLRIVTADSGSLFMLSLPHYSDQLVAGTSRTLRDQAVVVSMPDYRRLRATKDEARRVPAPSAIRENR